MNLTREHAITEHRKMWNWIADETNRLKRKVKKYEYFDTMGIHDIPLNGCYCCEFNRRSNSYHCGIDCIINWGKFLGCTDSYFAEWANTDDWKESARFARIIANLPERRIDEQAERKSRKAIQAD